MFEWLGYLLACYLAADLLAGFWHWWEDRYASEAWPIVGRYIAGPNQLHHAQPQAFLDQSYWSRNSTTIVPAGIAFALSWPNPVCGVFAFVSQANEIHAWAHSKGKLNPLIVTLQEIGLLQSPFHHAKHHKDPYSTRYCVMSDWCNPFLDRAGVWRNLEAMVAKATGIQARA